MNSTLQTSYRKEISEMFLESYARFSFHEYIWEDLTLLGTKNRVWISKDGVSVKLMQERQIRAAEMIIDIVETQLRQEK